VLPQVEFERPVDAKGNIEVWLQRLVDGMQDTVKQIIKRAVRNVYEMSLEDFIFGHPAQVRVGGSRQRGGCAPCVVVIWSG
jgi:dynein heavy chain